MLWFGLVLVPWAVGAGSLGLDGFVGLVWILFRWVGWLPDSAFAAVSECGMYVCVYVGWDCGLVVCGCYCCFLFGWFSAAGLVVFVGLLILVSRLLGVSLGATYRFLWFAFLFGWF